MEVFTIICSVLAAMSATVAILSFIRTKEKDKNKDVSDFTWLKTDLEYVRNGVDDLRLDIKELNRKQNDMSEKLARTDEQIRSLEIRVENIESKLK